MQLVCIVFRARFDLAESRDRIAKIHPVHAGMGVPRRAWSGVPRSARQIRILEDQRKRTTVRTLPDSGHEAERRFLDGPVVGSRRTEEAVADRVAITEQAAEHHREDDSHRERVE